MRPTDEQIKELMAAVTCAACGASYEASGVEVLGNRDDLWFLRVSCGSCATSSLVAALVRGNGRQPESAPAASQPEPIRPGSTPAEPAPLPPTRPVSQADVRAMRQYLATFDGDFQRLFGNQPGASQSRPAA